ncbi:hypothetical protein LZ30DRAFT_471420 [Colletotrichum cereale]|nr:hypothetical protein LZ30DRAFT_471420 [Colletotrichum cereale]
MPGRYFYCPYEKAESKPHGKYPLGRWPLCEAAATPKHEGTTTISRCLLSHLVLHNISVSISIGISIGIGTRRKRYMSDPGGLDDWVDSPEGVMRITEICLKYYCRDLNTVWWPENGWYSRSRQAKRASPRPCGTLPGVCLRAPRGSRLFQIREYPRHYARFRLMAMPISTQL